MKYLATTICLALAVSLAPAANAATAKKMMSPRSAKSIECSKQADAQNLHGKQRRAFRRKCLKGQTT